MVRLVISVEGTTEERFVKQLLEPHLREFQVWIHPVSLNGAIKFDRVVHEISKLARGFDYITTLYDFYGFAQKLPNESKEELETRLISRFDDKPDIQRKLIPYIQMHEFEGLLFSGPEAIASVLQSPHLFDWATDCLHNAQSNPEAINDSVETAPSKRLESAFPAYRKPEHGPNIAKQIGLQGIRARCRGFDQWLSRLENLTD